MTPVIDAHHHFWKTAAQAQPWRNPNHHVLARDYGPEQLRHELRNVGVDGTILVQSVDEPAENDRLAAYAANDFVMGAVAWLPLADPPSAYRELDRINPIKVCGVRQLIADDPLEWLTNRAIVDLFKELARRGLAWDVVPVTPGQVAAILKLSAVVPELKIVIDHLGRPPVDSQGWEPWACQIRELAHSPTTAVKVSVGINVLSTWNSWRRSDLLPYVEWAAQHFGPSRLMLASNWPIVLLKTNYPDAWRDLAATVSEVFPSQADQKQVSGGTATRWYGLAPKPTPH
ncbi:amidohydrolase family protein [Arthrobacter bambusae]|uniref:amidohydrolase family protein n=1 Tax=Arthrobacter bambusae TaxID=1338426 RepID=UPI001F5145F6|nr:amidohydrolase family protein [Arthrobacter bambusae]MCI0143789.1 amidohydrolase family protein [Arthrobacter bambusae]